MVCLLTEPAAALHALSHARLCACLWAAVGQANQTADTPDADVGNHSVACVARDLLWTCTTPGCLSGEESCLVVLQPAEVSETCFGCLICEVAFKCTYVQSVVHVNLCNGWWSLLCYASVYQQIFCLHYFFADLTEAVFAALTMLANAG